MNTQVLSEIAQSIVKPGKGILAADESTGTIKKRFDSIGLESTEANRRAYRDMLFGTGEAAPHIGGVIQYDETIRQSALDGIPFPELLKKQGIVPGIKVDTGARALPGSPGEKTTEGLDGLPARLAEYHGLGARFTKWRAVITVSETLPTRYGILTNAHALARYARASQEAGLVPIVEPEVMVMEGGHSLERSFEATLATLQAVFAELQLQGVSPEGMLLKPNMVLPGNDHPRKASVQEVAEATLRCLRRGVPAAVPGIVFLSGGQSEIDSTRHLDAMNRMGGLPWALSFSYGRALQASALRAWGGKAENVAAGRRAYAHRARCNGLAARGEYTDAVEKEYAA